MQRHALFLENPTPQLAYEGDHHPCTGDAVLKQDALGYRAARRVIAKETPNHPSLRDRSLWPDLPAVRDS